MGKRPFFLINMVIASKTMLIAIINSVKRKVLTIIIIFVITYHMIGDCDVCHNLCKYSFFARSYIICFGEKKQKVDGGIIV